MSERWGPDVDGLAAEAVMMGARLAAMGLGEYAGVLVGLARPCAYGVVVPSALVETRRGSAIATDGADVPCVGADMSAVLDVHVAEIPDAERVGLPSTGVLSLLVGEGDEGSSVRHVASYDDGRRVAGRVPVDGAGRLAFVLRLDPMPDALDALLRAGRVTEGLRDAYDALCGAAAFPPGAALKLGGHCLASGVPAGFVAASRATQAKPTLRESLRWGNLVTIAPPWSDVVPGTSGAALSVTCLREAMAIGDLSGTHAQLDDYLDPLAEARPSYP